MSILADIPEILRSALTYNEDAALIFTQIAFWIFFAAALLGYSIIYNRNSTAKSAYLLAVSIFFYYKASGFYFVLLVFITLANYGFALIIYKSAATSRRKKWLVANICLNLGLLAYFKYAAWITQTIGSILNMDIEAVNIFARTYNQVAGSNDFDVSLLILPVGISFYTFQALSYAIDVYRKKIAPVRNILDFGFYVSFFPQLVAGPIIRASEFIPQIYRKYCLTRQNFWRAVLLIMGGLTKKIIVSDYIAFNYVDRIFDAPTLYSGFELLMGAYAYAIQIYCDFSGYTDIAVGLAMILGFHLPINFNSPYKAHSMSDFWHRWHISLSTWLRDYLYIPLGGNRKGNRRTYLNLLITMLLGGLWHGASFKFVVWGGLHGAALIVERCLHKIIAPHILRSGVLRVVGIVITFHAVCLLWIVFRASDITAAADFITRIFVWFNSDSVVDIVMAYLPVFVIMAAAYCIHFLPTRLKEWVRRRFVAMPIAFKIIAIVIFVFLMYQMSAAETQPFIYFQF